MSKSGPRVIEVITEWYCPACGAEDMTKEVRPHVRGHVCPKRGFLSFAMVPKGTKAKIVAVEREDYVGKDLVRKDSNNRPVMAILTIRDDGQDATVYAPTAVGRAD